MWEGGYDRIKKWETRQFQFGLVRKAIEEIKNGKTIDEIIVPHKFHPLRWKAMVKSYQLGNSKEDD